MIIEIAFSEKWPPMNLSTSSNPFFDITDDWRRPIPRPRLRPLLLLPPIEPLATALHRNRLQHIPFLLRRPRAVPGTIRFSCPELRPPIPLPVPLNSLRLCCFPQPYLLLALRAAAVTIIIGSVVYKPRRFVSSRGVVLRLFTFPRLHMHIFFSFTLHLLICFLFGVITVVYKTRLYKEWSLARFYFNHHNLSVSLQTCL